MVKLTLTQAVLISFTIARDHSVVLGEWNRMMDELGLRPDKQRRLKKLKNETRKILETLIYWMQVSKGPPISDLTNIFKKAGHNAIARFLEKTTTWEFPTSDDRVPLQEHAVSSITTMICKHRMALLEWPMIIYCLELDCDSQMDIEESDNKQVHSIIKGTIKAWINRNPCPSLGNLIEIFKYADLNSLAGELESVSDSVKKEWTDDGSTPILVDQDKASSSSTVGYDDTDLRPAPATPIDPEYIFEDTDRNNKIKVRRITTNGLYNGLKFDEKKMYKMESKPRGHALIINIYKFRDQPERRGSHKDFLDLNTIFTQTHYDIFTEYDDYDSTGMQSWTKVRVLLVLEAFKQATAKKSYESCIIVIMSHGGEDATSEIITSDEETIKINKIVDLFDNIKFGIMKDKPKILLVNACRDKPQESKDGGCMGKPKEEEVEDNVQKVNHFIKVQSTVPWATSYRSPIYGSRFIFYFCKVFAKHACDTEFGVMFRDKIPEEMENHKGYEGQLHTGPPQTPSVNYMGLTRHLYFNPN